MEDIETSSSFFKKFKTKVDSKLDKIDPLQSDVAELK